MWSLLLEIMVWEMTETTGVEAVMKQRALCFSIPKDKILLNWISNKRIKRTKKLDRFSNQI